VKHILPNDVKEKKVMKALEEKDLVIFEKGVYSLNPDFVFADLALKRSYKEIIYASIDYDKRLAPKIKKEEVERLLKKYVQVNDSQDCFMVKYDIFYEGKKK